MRDAGLPIDRLVEIRLGLRTQIADAEALALNAERAKEALAEDHASRVHHLRAALARAERAIAKVHDGSYGRCDDCGEPIAPERLAAAPDTVRHSDGA